jgi:hypothetical protein
MRARDAVRADADERHLSRFRLAFFSGRRPVGGRGREKPRTMHDCR